MNLNKLTLYKTILLFLSLIPASVAFGAGKIHNIDVLVVYSNEATTVPEGKDISALAASFIEFANQTYKNSNTNLRLKLVHTEKVNVSGDNNISSQTLRNLANDGKVAQLREEYGADLVSLLTPRTKQGGGFLCGMGYVAQGSNGKLQSGSKRSGFSISAVDCGSTTFVHELGHNMALGHSAAQGSNGGVYPWGRGYGVNGKFTTIMAYPSAFGNAARVQQLSSPNQKKCLGSACGVDRNQNDGADAVGNINILAEQFSDYLPSAGTTPPPGGGNGGNLVKNGNFDSLTNWTSPKGNTATLQKTNVKVASASALKVSNRTVWYGGPMQSVPLENGASYKFSAHMRLATPSSARSNGKARLFIADDSGFRIQDIANKSIVQGQWTQLTSDFTFKTTGRVKYARLVFSGPKPSWDFYVDEVSLVKK